MQFSKLDGIHFKFSRYLKVSEVQVPELSANNNHRYLDCGGYPARYTKTKTKTNKLLVSRYIHHVRHVQYESKKPVSCPKRHVINVVFVFVFVFLLLHQASSFLMPYVRTSSKSRVDNSIIQVP